MSQIVTYDKLDIAECFTYDTIQEKKVPNTEQKYREIPLLYNYGTAENPVVDQFFLQGPELITYGGIQEKCSLSGGDKMEYSIPISLPQTEESLAFQEALNQVWLGCVGILDEMRVPLKLTGFKADNLVMAKLVLRHPIFQPVDEKGDVIQGRNSTLYTKLFRNAKEKTLFVQAKQLLDEKGEPVLDEEGKPKPTYEEVPWDILKNVDMSIIPLFHVKSIYCASKIALQIRLHSAVIMSPPTPKGSTSRQTDIINSLVTGNLDKVNQINQQIERLAKERAGLLKGAAQEVSKSGSSSAVPVGNAGDSDFLAGSASVPRANPKMSNPPLSFGRKPAN